MQPSHSCSQSYQSCSYSEIEQKQQRFRIEIRRKQIDSMLEMSRNKYNQYLMSEQKLHRGHQQEQLHNCHLDSIHFLGPVTQIKERINMRIDIGRIIQCELASEPNQKWFQAMRDIGIQLQKCANPRNMADEVKQWVALGLVARLQIVFQRQFWHLELMQISAEILESLLYRIPDDSALLLTLHSSQFIKLLLSYANPLHTLYHHYPNSSALLLSILNLISTILHKMPHLSLMCIEQQIVQSIVSLINGCSQLQKQNKEDEKTLVNNYNFNQSKKRKSIYFDLSLQSDHVFIGLVILLRLLKSQTSKKWKQTVLSIVVPLIYKNNLYRSHTKQTQRVALKLLSLAASSQIQPIISTIFGYKQMTAYLVNLLTVEQELQFSRSAAANIIASLSASSNRNNVQKLVLQFGVLDKMLDCHGLLANHQQCRQSIFRTVSNLVNTSTQLTKLILNHPIFTKLILPSCHYPQHFTYNLSIYIICSVIQRHNPTLIQTLSHLILEYKQCSHAYLALVETLLLYLEQSVLLDVSIVLEVLKALLIFVGFVLGVEVTQTNRNTQGNNYYNSNSNDNDNGQNSVDVIEALRNIYEFEKIMTAVQEKMPNKIVEQLVSKLLQLVYAT